MINRPASRRISRSVLGMIAIVVLYVISLAPALGQPLPFSSSPRGHVLVPVSIDGGEPLRFVLDTGAGRTTVTPELVQRLGLAPVPGETVGTRGVHGLTENPVVRIPSLRFGEAEVQDQEAVVLGLDHITQGKWQADGILGMDFLRGFDLRLDFSASSVALFPRASSPTDCAACPEGVRGTAFESIHSGFVLLPVTVDGHPVKAVLDTGSGHSGLNSRAAESLGVELPPLPAGSRGGHGFGLQTGPVRLGNQVLTERPTLRVMDHPVMEALGLADSPSMLMGTDQLAGRTLTISYALGMVYVE
jgi:predicted aspartyl protease